MSTSTPQPADSQRKSTIGDSGTEVPDAARGAKLPTRGPSARRGEVRQRILQAARAEFLEHGYDATTMSQIAKQAGCTPAMVTYYFDSKQLLFRECFNLPLDPAQMFLEILTEGREGAGERLARRALQLYEDELTADAMRALMQALMTDAATSQRFRDYVRHDVMDVVVTKLGFAKELVEEIEFAMATAFGVVTMRYIVRLEPLASMPRERLVQQLATLYQHRIDRAYTRRNISEAGRGW